MASVSSSSSDENNVGNDALFVIGLHGSGDTIALFLQDWEVAKVALSCHIALDMLCQELYEVERRRGWFGFYARLGLQKGKEVNDTCPSELSWLVCFLRNLFQCEHCGWP